MNYLFRIYVVERNEQSKALGRDINLFSRKQKKTKESFRPIY